MSTLVVRNVDVGVKERLRVRSAHNGRSMEAELRVILSTVLAAEPAEELDLAEAIRRRFAPFGGVELSVPPASLVGDPPKFD